MKRYIITTIALSMLTACTTNYDCSTTFIFSGTIISQGDSKGVEGASIYFVDTGYDSVHSKKQNKHEVASTDATGRIQGSFDYWWGYEKGIFYQEPKETLDIVIEKPGYRSKTLHFTGKNRNINSREVQVKIGTVEMERSESGVQRK